MCVLLLRQCSSAKSCHCNHGLLVKSFFKRGLGHGVELLVCPVLELQDV